MPACLLELALADRAGALKTPGEGAGGEHLGERSISRTRRVASAGLRRVLQFQQQFEPAVLLVSKRCKTAPIQCQDSIGP